MGDDNERRHYHIWIDASGEVWIEDPDRGAMPLARALDPAFELPVARPMLAPAVLALTKAIAAPPPWPETLDGLWELHDHLLAAGRRGTANGDRTGVATLLDLKRAIAQRLFRGCVLCEHRCGVDRAAGERGICKVGPDSYFADAYVHLAEEREIAPSLCLALTGCSWHCVYCHTFEIINRIDHGTVLEPAAYPDLFARLQSPEVRTLSFVGGNPDHHLPAILEFLAAAPNDFAVPIVWNSNMFGSPELYRLLDGVVDVYLGDFRYGADACAKRLSGLSRCWEPVTRNWLLVAAQPALSIVRLLILPGHLDCCVTPMVRWLAANLPNARVSLLGQFHPAYLVAKRAPELNRTPTIEELKRAADLVATAGLSTVLDDEP